MPVESGLSRRSFLAGAGSTVAVSAQVVGTFALGGITGASLGYAAGYDAGVPQPEDATVDFYGTHQAGIATESQAQAVFVTFDLKPGVGRERFIALMKLLTDDAARLTQGRPALPDNDPVLARDPARLSITFGFGRSLFDALGLGSRIPRGFIDIPEYPLDELEPRFCGGDLIVQCCADDPLALAHAVRQITRTAIGFTTVRWTQRGFVGQAGRSAETGTPRNHMGQLDGTVNPGRFGLPFDEYVWAEQAGWFTGGTMLVVRRIAMNLPTWDKLNDVDKEHVIGRRIESGAPLGGHKESDPPDLVAVGAANLPVIDLAAHIRRAAPSSIEERFLRRPFSYDDGILGDGDPDAGLIFAAFAANLETQYLPVQNRLAEKDLLNKWTTTRGSATFVIPPGTAPGGYIGEGLFQ